MCVLWTHRHWTLLILYCAIRFFSIFVVFFRCSVFTYGVQFADLNIYEWNRIRTTTEKKKKTETPRHHKKEHSGTTATRACEKKMPTWNKTHCASLAYIHSLVYLFIYTTNGVKMWIASKWIKGIIVFRSVWSDLWRKTKKKL